MEEMNKENIEDKIKKRDSLIMFDRSTFAKLIINDLSKSKQGKSFLKKYKQSEVREIIENYKVYKNQERLVEISQLLYAKSPQYKRLLNYFATMALFPYIITPKKDIKKVSNNKVVKQYYEIAELAKMMNIKYEMTKVMKTAFIEDVFYGYVYKTNKTFYIQKLDFKICRISSVEDGAFNFSINMSHFKNNLDELKNQADEIQIKFYEWLKAKEKNSKISDYVELDARNTICIKVNEEMIETFPPFAGSFDAIFDIEGFKQLRKDKEEIQNYMVLAQKLPMRTDSDNNNDFMIDSDTMTYFHNLASNAVPDNVGVITSPMEIEPLRFIKDGADTDGVAKATRDFWEGSGTSQLLFSTDSGTSQGVLSGIKTDEQIVYTLISQINTWINRYLRFNFKDLMFNLTLLNVSYFNAKEVFDMYLQAGQYGVPVKSHLCAVVGLEPVEMMGMAYLENDLLKLQEEFIPLQSSHTQSGGDNGDGSNGAPKKDANELTDEGAKSRDKASSNNV